MRNSIAILFFAIYLFSTTEVHQLLKLPVFFQHFSEHQKEDNKISMLHFLAIHYLDAGLQNKDYERDRQLPFKSTSDCISDISNVYVPLIVSFFIAKPVELPQKKNFIISDQYILSSYLANIWQPPKPAYYF